jgi:hypothetical protein
MSTDISEEMEAPHIGDPDVTEHAVRQTKPPHTGGGKWWEPYFAPPIF